MHNTFISSSNSMQSIRSQCHYYHLVLTAIYSYLLYIYYLMVHLPFFYHAQTNLAYIFFIYYNRQKAKVYTVTVQTNIHTLYRRTHSNEYLPSVLRNPIRECYTALLVTFLLVEVKTSFRVRGYVFVSATSQCNFIVIYRRRKSNKFNKSNFEIKLTQKFNSLKRITLHQPQIKSTYVQAIKSFVVKACFPLRINYTQSHVVNVLGIGFIHQEFEFERLHRVFQSFLLTVLNSYLHI